MGDKNPKLSYAQQRAARQARVERDAARKRAYERRDADRAATMRKRALPEDVGSDGKDVRAPRYTPHKNTP